MMSLTTQSAQAQYFSRPADEKFTSLSDLHAAALADANRCARALVPLNSLEAIKRNDDQIALRGKATGQIAELNHWSFSQLCSLVKAPAGYLRTLSPQLATDNLNYGLQANATSDPAQLYLRRNGVLTLRAITTPTYERLHDATFVAKLMTLQAQRPQLDLPPVWDKGIDGKRLQGGAYRGDRDAFVIMTDGGSIVDDPTMGGIGGGGNGTMYRGIIARNSEVGGSTVEMLTFLFRGICGNHCIWGVQGEQHSKRRHIGKVAESFDQMVARAMKFFDRPASDDVARINQLAAIELGKDKKEVVQVGRGLGLTETAAIESYTAAEQHEPNPRSVWGYAQGITRVSQQAAYQDERFALDLIAAKLLRRKVAA